MHWRNAHKYYDYYQDAGHNTNGCIAFKTFIEKLIANSYLKEYVVNHRQAVEDITMPPAITSQEEITVFRTQIRTTQASLTITPKDSLATTIAPVCACATPKYHVGGLWPCIWAITPLCAHTTLEESDCVSGPSHCDHTFEPSYCDCVIGPSLLYMLHKWDCASRALTLLTADTLVGP